MEILVGESACYNLLAFISLKMELQWRKNPTGKVFHKSAAAPMVVLRFHIKRLKVSKKYALI
jgi:hypothetical protein